jgi:hypothetical protein
MKGKDDGAAKRRVLFYERWYVDAAIEAWGAAFVIALLFGGSCPFVPSVCFPIVGFAALAIFLGLTVVVIYLAATQRRRLGAGSRRGDARIGPGAK